MPLKAVIAAYCPKKRKTMFLYAVPTGPLFSYSQLKNVKLEWVNNIKAASRFDAILNNAFESSEPNLSFDPVTLNQEGEIILQYLSSHIQNHLPQDFTSLRIHAFHVDPYKVSSRIVQERFPVYKQISPKMLKKTPKLIPKIPLPSQFAPKKVTTTKPNANNDIFPTFDVSIGIHPIAHEIPIPRLNQQPPKPNIKTIHPVTPKQLDLD